MLQHGSILLGPVHRRLSEFVRAENEEVRATLRENLETKTTELNSVLGRNVSFDEVALALRRGFERTWNIIFTEITGEELRAGQETEPSFNN